MSALSKLTKKVSTSLFGGGSSSTYSSPDLSVLQTAAPTVNYDFLRTAAGDAGNLASQGKTYQDYIKTTTPNADNYFQDYINSINAPSSVDQVQSQLNNEKLTNTLANIERDTNQRFGSTIMDQYLRGLTGGGAASDIAGSALASVAAAGGRSAADARTALYQSELDRAAEREKAAEAAYGTRYTTGANADLADKQLQAQLAESAAQGYNSLLSAGAGNQASLFSQYASGLQSEADREMQRRLGLAGQLTASASDRAQNTQRNTGLAGTMMNSFAGGFGQGLGSSACFLPATPIEMADGSTKQIKDVEIGDVTRGGEVLEIRKAKSSDVYDYKGIGVSGSHCVLEGEWKRVKNSSGISGLIPGDFVVYNLVTTDHRIFVSGVMFDDNLETGEHHLHEDGHLEYLKQGDSNGDH